MHSVDMKPIYLLEIVVILFSSPYIFLIFFDILSNFPTKIRKRFQSIFNKLFYLYNFITSLYNYQNIFSVWLCHLSGKLCILVFYQRIILVFDWMNRLKLLNRHTDNAVWNKESNKVWSMWKNFQSHFYDYLQCHIHNNIIAQFPCQEKDLFWSNV